jgi:very-short-patch-repair endonuclease
MENAGRLEELPEGFAVPQSPFEEEVYAALTKAGLQVDCQVGDSRYKIDFGIRHPKTNKYLLAIEADGWTYHSSPYARERDWLRQEVLERKGWTFVRIWSTDWWQNPTLQVNRVIAAYELAMKSEGLKPAYKDVAAPSVISTSDEYDGNAEYEVLRGLVAQRDARRCQRAAAPLTRTHDRARAGAGPAKWCTWRPTPPPTRA